MSNTYNKPYELIEMSDDASEYEENSVSETSNNDIYKNYQKHENRLVPIEYYADGSGKSEVREGFMEISLIKRNIKYIKNRKINSFIKFCIKNNLFDNNFYDYGNVFSILGTKLTDTFNNISKNGSYIKKSNFIKKFKKVYKYKKYI